MADPKAKNLRIYPAEPDAAGPPQIEAVRSLPRLLEAFQGVTGWSLRYVAGAEPNARSESTWSARVTSDAAETPGHLRLEMSASEPSVARRWPLDPQTARSLASAVTETVAELLETRCVLWQREAELAAAVPVIPHHDEQSHLAARLEAILKAGAEAVDCQAAALYLLDEATTELKLRSGWGLPHDWLTEAARPLKGSLADLEALLGSAVVLRDPAVMRVWRVPEVFPAAVCLPVATPTTLLGTLWVYGQQNRDFSDRETNLLEVVTGRLATELEREMLLREGVAAAELKSQLAAAERLQRHQLPAVSPLLDGWELSGWTASGEAVGGQFYDWFCLPDGLLAIAMGDTGGRGIPAALSASALKAALRAHGQYHRDPQQMLRQLNLTVWTSSAGDQRSTVFYGLVATADGRLCWASAGQPGAVLVRPDGWQVLSPPTPPLGESPEADYPQFGCDLQPGEVLAIFTDGLREASDDRGRPLGRGGLAELLTARLDLPAERLSGFLQDYFRGHAAPSGEDQTLLIVKRTHP